MKEGESEADDHHSDSSQELFSFDDINITPKKSKVKRAHQRPAQPIAAPGNDDQEVVLSNFVSSDIGNDEKGRVTIEDFQIISVLGKGAYGKVYLVQKNTTQAYFAMKVLKKASIVVHEKETEHTLNERTILDKLKHPFIVKLYYAFQSPARLYLILTYAQGGELFNFLAEEKMLTDQIARFYISELLLAIEHLHSLGIIYRDLKPENVLLDHEGHILLTDFGLSKIALDARSVCGTVEFMAPEVLEERVSYGKTVDFWSLGVMLYDMIVGHGPFTGGNRQKIMENVIKKKPIFPKYMTANTRDLCTKLLKKNPAVRLGHDGIQQIKSHRFFGNTNWNEVLLKRIAPPHVPIVNSPTDTSNFTNEFTSLPISESNPNVNDLLANDRDLANQELFRGFSFVAPSL